MFGTASLSTKLIRIGASLLVVALASISLTLWVTWQLEGGAAAVNEAGRMRMQTWRLASAVQSAAPADAVAARDPFARRVWDSQRAFRERMRGWHAVSEVPYYQARG